MQCALMCSDFSLNRQNLFSFTLSYISCFIYLLFQCHKVKLDDDDNITSTSTYYMSFISGHAHLSMTIISNPRDFSFHFIFRRESNEKFDDPTEKRRYFSCLDIYCADVHVFNMYSPTTWAPKQRLSEFRTHHHHHQVNMSVEMDDHERKIVNEFCHYLEKSKQLFNGLRQVHVKRL